MPAAFFLGHRLLPGYTSLCAPLVQQCRLYALSRFPHRSTGFGRNSGGNMARRIPSDPPSEDRPWTSPDHEKKPSVDHSQLWRQGLHSAANSDAGMRRLLANNDELIITRQLEMLNIFMGFEQSNRYVIANPAGESLGYIVEEPRGFFSMFARQVFRTHRPFRALVMDLEGSPMLWIRRPFSWISSRMFVQRPGDVRNGESVLDTFAEVQQEWHPWRRRYDSFLRLPDRYLHNIGWRDITFGHFQCRRPVPNPFTKFRSTPRRILTTLGSGSQPELATPEAHFNQFARIDEGLWAWHFVLRDAQGEDIATINRAFRGFGREILTDTGQYTISFRAQDEQEQVYSSSQDSGVVLHKPGAERDLTVDERALVLAMAINIDYDYFSRHSGGHGFGFWWSSGE